jgi:hypothetical protein
LNFAAVVAIEHAMRTDAPSQRSIRAVVADTDAPIVGRPRMRGR